MRRADDGSWQGITGGGENDETPVEAAKKEAAEEQGRHYAKKQLEIEIGWIDLTAAAREGVGELSVRQASRIHGAITPAPAEERGLMQRRPPRCTSPSHRTIRGGQIRSH